MSSKKSERIFRFCLCMTLSLVMLLSLVACAKQDPLRTDGKKNIAMVSIETAYADLHFPEYLYENIRHMEVTEGNVAMEIFYMVNAGGEKELYRIHFADGHMGTQMGYLQTESGEISVGYSVCEYGEFDFANEDEWKLYHDLMGAFSTMLTAIQEDPSFAVARQVESVGSGETKLRYWTVTLPENVQYEESEENGNYRVDFYGMVGGERIDLYYLGLGEIPADAVLGYFTVNGNQMPLVVGNNDMDAYENWPEENKIVIYNMMSSLNDIIQEIVTHKGYSEFQE